MKITYSTASKIDLNRIGEWIAQHNPIRAAEIVEELLDRCEHIPDFPYSGEVIQRYRGEHIRRKVHGNYLILYALNSDVVTIVRIIHGAEDYLRVLD